MVPDVEAKQQAGSTLRENLHLVARWRTLHQVQARADRAALTLRDDGQRARRLYLYVLKECGQPWAAEDRQTTTESLGRSARRALQTLIRPLKRALLRRILLTVVGAVVICGAGLLVALSIPSARAWLFPPDLGRTAQWRVTSAMGGNGKTGVGAGSDAPIFFHTVQENNPHIDLDFGKVVSVRRVVIENRSDCCGERALPLNVEVMEADGPRLLCQRRSPFQSWTCNTGGVRTRTLRIRRPGPTMLHLRRIEVYE